MLILLIALFANIPALREAVTREASPANWLALARGYADEGREPEAIRAYEKSSLPEAREEGGWLLRYADPARAIQQLSESPSLSARIRLIELLLTHQQPAEAEQHIIALLERDRDVGQFLPDWSRRRGHQPKLHGVLDAYVQRNPNSRGAACALAESFARSRRNIDALQVVERILETAPDVDAYRVMLRANARLPRHLVDYLHQLETRLANAARQREEKKDDSNDANHARAMIAALEREHELLPALIPICKQRLDNRQLDDELDACQLMLDVAAAGDQLAEAERTLLSWRNVGPIHEPSVVGGLFRVYELQGKSQKALDLANFKLNQPGNTSIVLLHYHRARALMMLNREEEAIAAAAEAARTASDAGMLGTRLLRYDVYAWFGKQAEARALAKELLQEFTDVKSQTRIRQHLSSDASRRGDDAAAEAHLRCVLEIAPKDVGSHNDLGYHLAERGRKLAEAEAMCRFAVERGRPAAGGMDAGGDDPSYRDSLGWVLFRRGKMAEAREQLERALALPGGRHQAVIWDHLGDVLTATGQNAEAKAAWREAQQRIERARRSRDDPRAVNLARKLASP